MRYVLPAALIILAGCTRSPAPEPAAGVILITVDTLRADHLECYGYPAIRTPSINKLASDGVLFRQTIAQVPLTLPSHCSILTGTYPNATGVRDQAGFTLAEDRTTLAEILKPAGFETAAFVASTVLGSEYGLKQGFDLYSEVHRTSESGPDAERRGDQVMDEALSWIAAPGRRRFFAWIHLFDPHTPYEPPEPYRAEYPQSPYDGEIAFVDSLIGRLIRVLTERGLYEKTIIIFTSDHGESLGEHGEETHGLLLYDATLRVPLIVKPAGPGPRSREIGEQVRGIDIVPTILELLSVAVPQEVQGQSLVPLIDGSRSNLGLIAYSETYFPYYHFQWSPLLAARTLQHKYIHAPRPELYDLWQDAGETRNVIKQSPDAAGRMSESLLRGYAKFAVQFPQAPGKVDAATLRRLKSLGYIGSPAARVELAEGLPDPKDKIKIYNLLQQALAEAEQGRTRDSIAKLKQVLRQDSKLVDAHLNLGVNYAQLGEFSRSVESLQRVLAINSGNVIARFNLGLSYANLDRLADAAREFSKTVELDPRYSEAWAQLGRVRQLRGQIDEAIAAYKEAVQLDPRQGLVHHCLSEAYQAKGLREAADAEKREAERLGHR